jgi:hypothetical protein
MKWFIPKMIQKLVFGCASIPAFRSAKMTPISNRGSFLHWLRLIKILGASFAKNQLLNHVGYIFFCLFTAVVFSENLYQTHLPKNIYECALQQELVDENSSKNMKEMNYGDAMDAITVSIEEDQGQYALVGYWFGQVVDNLSGMQVAYRRGKIIAYVVFDGIGRDYLMSPPFSREDEKNISLNLLDLMEGGYMKLSEASEDTL